MTVRLTPVWVTLRCLAGQQQGRPCGRRYVADARSAPQFDGRPYCRACWDRAMRLRAQLGWTVYETPAGTWPEEYDEPVPIPGRK